LSARLLNKAANQNEDRTGQLLYTKQSGGPSAAKDTRYIYLNRHLIAEVAK